VPKTHLIRKLFEGKLRLETQNENPMVYARTYLQRKLRVFRTMHTNEHSAAKAASDWYLDLLHRHRHGERLDALTFGQAAADFIADPRVREKVSALQHRNYRHKWNLLQSKIAGIEDIKVTDIDTAWLEHVRDVRAQDDVKPTTVKKDLMFVSSVLKWCKAKKVVDTVPDLPAFSGKTWGIVSKGRTYLDAAEYKHLITTAWKRMREPDLNPRVLQQRRELYLMIHIMVGAALRVGEALSLRWCDCYDAFPMDHDETKRNMLEMDVLGKHSKHGQREKAFARGPALIAFRRLEMYAQQRGVDVLKSDALIFTSHRDGFRELLDAAGLRDGANGTRDMKSLRPTGITLRLEETENPNYRDVAKWARTSPEMIAKFYDQIHPATVATRLLRKRKR
jgi:integrase